MEILNTNYNGRNPIVAGFLPILKPADEDQVDGQQATKSNQAKSTKRNFQILITTTNSQQSACSLRTTFSQLSNPMPTTIYQIDVSKVCTPTIYTPKLRLNQPSASSSKSKKTLRNKRQKEARRKRRNQRHVHFPEQDELIVVIVIDDDECIKEYRNKYWEFFAIDRNRFEHRVKKMSDTLERVLVPSHRERIYKERFSCDESEEEETKLDSGCDSTNTDSDHQGSNKDSKKKSVKSEKRRPSRADDGESGFEPDSSEHSESETDDKDNNNEISLSITLTEATLTRFHFYTSN